MIHSSTSRRHQSPLHTIATRGMKQIAWSRKPCVVVWHEKMWRSMNFSEHFCTGKKKKMWPVGISGLQKPAAKAEKSHLKCQVGKIKMPHTFRKRDQHWADERWPDLTQFSLIYGSSSLRRHSFVLGGGVHKSRSSQSWSADPPVPAAVPSSNPPTPPAL